MLNQGEVYLLSLALIGFGRCHAATGIEGPHFPESPEVSNKNVALKVNLNVISKTLNWVEVPDSSLKGL